MQASQFPFRPPISTSGLQNSTESGTNGRSLPMKPTTHLFLTSIAAGYAALLVGCASTQSMSQNRESMLVASGFRVITPKTAAQKQKLQNLPAGTVTMIKKGKKNYYVFPDPAHNQAYVGGPKEYQAYQQLRADKKLSREDLQDARCIRMQPWSGAYGGVAKEYGDPWAGRCREGFSQTRTSVEAFTVVTGPFGPCSKQPWKTG